ncbi:MAG TPA: PDZ domain-containing protein [Candidatus Krumholzibacteria bacterium]|nr:PDZ domain-containing protein [Candidatus Krumholzibacteria bacterium]
MNGLRILCALALLLSASMTGSADPPAPLATPFTPEKFGIGAVFVQPDSTHDFIVKGTFENGPAARAGVAAGDTLLEVDGQSVASWPFSRLLDYILRDQPLSITLTVKRGAQSLSFQMTRARFSDIAAGAGLRIEKNPVTGGYMSVPADAAPPLKKGDRVEYEGLLDRDCKPTTFASAERPTFIYFWASWCAPCKSLIARMKADEPRANIRVIGVNVDRDCTTFQAALAKIDPPGEQVWAGWDGRLPQGLMVCRLGIPIGALVSEDGTLLDSALGVEGAFSLFSQNNQ